MMSKEAMKLALETLEGLEALLLSMGLTHLIVYGDAEKAITALRQALANEVSNEALDRMADNARELGLDYTGNGTAGREKDVKPTGFFFQMPQQPAQQEPVAWMDIDENGTFSGLRYWSEPDNRHEVALYTSPPAQRTWVGLTNDEVNNLAAGCHLGNSVQDAIYKAAAKLKEKNNA